MSEINDWGEEGTDKPKLPPTEPSVTNDSLSPVGIKAMQGFPTEAPQPTQAQGNTEISQQTQVTIPDTNMQLGVEGIKAMQGNTEDNSKTQE